MDVDRETMAGALVELVVEGEYPPGYMLRFTELRKVYREMCQQNGWRERGWVSVARHFDLITTGGEKPYAYFYDEEGRARRLRVYPISRDKPRAALKVA